MPVQATGISFPGNPNSDATLARALRLAQYGGRVLAAFLRKTQLRSMIWSPQMRGGQTFQYPAIGRIAAAFHTSGSDVFEDAGFAGRFNHTKRTVEVDDELIAPTFVPKLEILETEYEFMSVYLDKLGEALAVTYETFAFTAGFRAARHTTANTTNLIPTDLGVAGAGGFVGSIDITTGLTPAERGGAILAGLFEAQILLNEKEVPEAPRWAFMSPARYSWLAQNRELIDRDFGGEGNGLFYMGTVLVGAGFSLISTNRMPTTNITTNPAGARNTYTGNFTQTVALAVHGEAIVNPTLQAPMVETKYSTEKRGEMLIASMVQGVGPLRYESAVELSSAVAQPAL